MKSTTEIKPTCGSCKNQVAIIDRPEWPAANRYITCPYLPMREDIKKNCQACKGMHWEQKEG